MPIRSVRTLVVVLCAGALVGTFAAAGRSTADDDELGLTFNDASGQIRTVDVTGDIDLDNPFFQELGANGRSCFSCHRPAEGWTVAPQSVRVRFAATAGLDPIFRPNDGSNCEGADVSTLPRRIAAFSLLLTRGLIRVGIDVPVGAEFVIESVDDPYKCGAPLTQASMYRRPLPSTNLRFLSAVMWDGRESSPTTTILQDLAKQADDATTGHAEASLHLTPAQAQQIVAFETGLFTAQRRDNLAGSLTAAGALGGPVNLSQQLFFTGITRSANTILAEQTANVADRIPQLNQLRDLAGEAVDGLRAGDVSSLGAAMCKGWQAKRTLASGVSTQQIDVAVEAALEAGASGAKVTGAGGGGFLLVVCPVENQRAVRDRLADMKELPINLEPHGSRVIFNVHRDIWI